MLCINCISVHVHLYVCLCVSCPSSVGKGGWGLRGLNEVIWTKKAEWWRVACPSGQETVVQIMQRNIFLKMSFLNSGSITSTFLFALLCTISCFRLVCIFCTLLCTPHFPLSYCRKNKIVLFLPHTLCVQCTLSIDHTFIGAYVYRCPQEATPYRF